MCILWLDDDGIQLPGSVLFFLESGADLGKDGEGDLTQWELF